MNRSIRDRSIRWLSRRATLIVLPLLSIATFFIGTAARAQNTRPNILFCVSDDQSWLHTGVAGDPVVKTPNFDRVARNGVFFTQAYCASPSCTPSRAAILTGQDFSRLEESGNLHSTLPRKFAVYPDLLEAAGYTVGLAGKGWGPGDPLPGGRTRNPAGPGYKDFATFLSAVPDGKPFCFWFGSRDPHRPYDKDSGKRAGIDPAKVRVPGFLPDHPTVRADIADYLAEVERFDKDVGQILELLDKTGRLKNTIVVVTSDNGMPFPRAKTTLYDSGTHMPLAIQWPAQIPGGRTVTDFVNLIDLAPTFLQAAGVSVPPDATGKSLLSLLKSGKRGRVEAKRDRTYFGRERHDVFRRENGAPVGYPQRAVRTDKFLYIRNFRPERVPSGDDPNKNQDLDQGPSKTFVAEGKSDPKLRPFYEQTFALRRAEELYDVMADPDQRQNIASDPRYAPQLKELRADLDRWMSLVKDPRRPGTDLPAQFDQYPVRTGSGAAPKAPR